MGFVSVKRFPDFKGALRHSPRGKDFRQSEGASKDQSTKQDDTEDPQALPNTKSADEHIANQPMPYHSPSNARWGASRFYAARNDETRAMAQIKRNKVTQFQ